MTPRVGQLVHVTKYNPGCVWRVVRIVGDMACLETPKTRKPFGPVGVWRLRPTNRDAAKAARVLP